MGTKFYNLPGSTKAKAEGGFPFQINETFFLYIQILIDLDG